MEEAPPLGKRLASLRARAGLRQQDIAKRANAVGLPWTRVAVASIEMGRRRIDGDDLLLLPVIYQQSLMTIICPDDLPTDVSPNLRVTADQLSDLLRSDPAAYRLDGSPSRPKPTDLEKDAARKLGISVAALQAVALSCLGCPVDEHRDQAVAAYEGSQRGLRGRATRRLVEQLRIYLDEGGS